MEAFALMAMRWPLFLSRPHLRTQLRSLRSPLFPKWKGETFPRPPSALVALSENAVMEFPVAKPQPSGPLISPDMFVEKRNILEPAGALALAGAEAYCKYYGLKGKNVIAITSGANMNFDKLRVVTELANVGRRREAVLATVMPEKPGSFKHLCELMGTLNITEFKYRCSSDKEAVVLYGPRALMKFLDAVSPPRWNITMFHYSGQGETGADVLVAIQVPDSEMNEFKQRARDIGYDYELVVNDDGFRLVF